MKRDVQVIAAVMQGRIDFGVGKTVHAVQRLHPQHIAPKLEGIEYGRMRESDPAREREPVE